MNKYKNNGLNFLKNTMYMRRITLIKSQSLRKRKIHIAHYRKSMPHAC